MPPCQNESLCETIPMKTCSAYGFNLMQRFYKKTRLETEAQWPTKAGVHVNLSEILVSLKRG